MAGEFVHLHVHTEYSLLDGACRVKDLLARAEELGMRALAITDHGVMFGVLDFYKEAKKRGIKPVVGCEVYMAARSRFDKTAGLDAKSSHLILLAKNNEGYKNLTKLVSAGFTDGYYYRPRIDFDILEAHSEGLIALSACLSGDIPSALLAGDEELASRLALKYKGIFGADFYIELQDAGLPEQRAVNGGLIRLAHRHGIPLVVTNDVHYIKREDAKAQDVLMCIQTGKSVNDEDRMKMSTDEFYLKSGDEMRERFKDFEEAFANTARIAEQCTVDFEFNKLRLPRFALPEGEDDAYAYLCGLCAKGLAARYGDDPPDEVRERLSFELSVIRQMGFVDYMLIVWDFIRFARERGIPVGPGRGSAAGSLVSYTLWITDVDPIRYNLLFERFLNPERVTMPDIDIDFCYERRQEVIDYVVGKYGADHVAQIITFGTMAARAVIRDVGRALDIPYGDVDKIAKLIPFQIGMTIDRALEANAEFATQYRDSPVYRDLIDMARKLEGMPRHASTHAAGVLITDLPVTEYVPLQMNDECVTTQFPMGQIEELGLLKMDFLGLRTLTVIHDTLDSIRETRGLDVDIGAIDLTDANVYRMICEGKTSAIFQLESGGMTQFITEMQPGVIEDLIAGSALYRPGPMESIPRYIEGKKNHDRVRYDDPKLEPILDVTYGCIVYQEQVMQIVRELAGYSYGRADLVRRAMSKKKHDVMDMERKNFVYGRDAADGSVEILGCVRNGVPEAVAQKIFDDMTDFASYAFNKSHSAAYAMLIYQTAWLKYYYPVEFMAATLNSCMGFADKVAHYIELCRQSGISVLPPDINQSFTKFSVDGGALRFGLAAIKNVGTAVVNTIIAERRARGPFRSFTDFLRRSGTASLNKRGIESLVRAGAFDALGATRASLVACYERLYDGITAVRRNEMSGQVTFLTDGDGDLDGADAGGVSDDTALPVLPEFPLAALLNMEKEILGLYVSGHPLDGYFDVIGAFANCDTRAFRGSRTSTDTVAGDADGGGEADAEGADGGASAVRDGQNAVLGGIVARVKTKLTKAGSLMAFADIEDAYGSVEALVFPKVYERLERVLKADCVALLKGRVSAREDEDAKLICEDLAEIDASLRDGGGLDGAGRDGGAYARLKAWSSHGNHDYGGFGDRDRGYARGGDTGAYGRGGNSGGAGNGRGDAMYEGDGSHDYRDYGSHGNYDYGDGLADTTKAVGAAELAGTARAGNKEVTLFIRLGGDEPKAGMDAAYATMRYFSGRTPVVLYNRTDRTRRNLGREYAVKLSDTLLAELRERFGADNVVAR